VKKKKKKEPKIYQLRKNEIGVAFGTYGVKRNAYRVLVWKHEVVKPPLRPRNRWKDNIKRDLKWDTDGRELDYSGSGQQPVSGCCECGKEPSGSIKCGEFLD